MRDLVAPDLMRVLATGKTQPDTQPDRSPLSPEQELKRHTAITQTALGVGTLGSWLDRYADRLGDLTPPWTVPPTQTGAWSFAKRLGRRASAIVDRSGRERPIWARATDLGASDRLRRWSARVPSSVAMRAPG